jgi:ABC-2 type transport system ATP-binding protein
VDELKRIPRGRLKVRTRDCLAALPILREAGYSSEMTQDGAIEVVGTAAIDQPDQIASLLVHAGCALTMLNVEQEDLEHYFLKLVGAEAEVTQ